ncbi:MAG: hypothetical protein IID16_06045 [Candidatus Marinimicrobia bacterium]|nr:hypothetical protein [Candidatus Neomarinimicrobiota bacterium]
MSRQIKNQESRPPDTLVPRYLPPDQVGIIPATKKADRQAGGAGKKINLNLGFAPPQETLRVRGVLKEEFSGLSPICRQAGQTGDLSTGLFDSLSESIFR